MMKIGEIVAAIEEGIVDEHYPTEAIHEILVAALL